MMDPTCDGAYGHSKEFRHDKSVLRRDGVSVPSQPQVQVLGQGTFKITMAWIQLLLDIPLISISTKTRLPRNKWITIILVSTDGTLIPHCMAFRHQSVLLSLESMFPNLTRK